MPDNSGNFAAYAGRVLFPRTPDDLTNRAQCPACFQVLTSTVCQYCSLDLGHPAAAELAATSREAADLLEARLNLIGRIRFETDAAKAERAAAARVAPTVVAEPAIAVPTVAVPIAQPAAFVPPVAVAPPSAVRPSAVRPSAVPPSAAPPAAQPATRSRSSIQVLLLIAGVSLLSLAAMSFLIYAFVNYGIEWRSAIIAAITVATFTIASLLRRRGYAGTAEGIAVFAVVLVYLDAFAVRANNLFGAESAQPQVYWGATLLASALGFVLWHRLSGLRVPSVAGFSALGVGAGLLVYGLGESLESPTRFVLSMLATAAIALLHPLAGGASTATVPERSGLPERVMCLVIAVVALISAILPAFILESGAFWAASLALLALGGVGFAHVALTVVGRGAELRPVRGLGIAFAAVAGVSTAAAASATLLHSPVIEFGIIVPPAFAALVVLLLDTAWRFVARRDAAVRAVRALRVAELGAAIVAGILLLVPLFFAAVLALGTVDSAVRISAWNLRLGDPLAELLPGTGAAVGALGIVTALVIAFSAASRRLAARRTLLTITVSGLAVAAVPLLVTEWLVVGGWLLLSALGVAALIVLRSSGRLPRSSRVIVAVGSLVAATLGYLASWASVDSWLAGSLTTIVLLVAARWAFTSVAGRAGLLAAAVVLGNVGAIGLAQQLTLAQRTGLELGADTEISLRFTGILAMALILMAAVLPNRLVSVTDRRTLFLFGLPVAVITTAVLWLVGPASSLLREPLTSALASAALLVVLVTWISVRRDPRFAIERAVASLTIAPAAFFALHAIGLSLRSTELTALAALFAAVLVAAGGLVLAVLRPSGAQRIALDVGTALVAAAGLLSAVAIPADTTWLALLLAGIATLLVSVSLDGLFGSASWRRQLGWLSLALATAALWWRLITDDVTALEPYVLPLSGALLLVALLVWRVQRESRAAPFIALGGLLVALLPLGVNGATGDLARPFIVGAVSAVLLLSGSWLRVNGPLRRYLDVAAAAGAAGVLTASIARASGLPHAIERLDLRFDAWLWGACALLVLAAFGQTLARTNDNPRLRADIGQTLAALGLGTVVLFEGASLDASDLAQVRVLAVLALCALVATFALTLDRGPLRPNLGWIATGGAALISLAALVTFTLEPVELAAVLVVLALATSATALAVTLVGSSPITRTRREIGFAVLAGLSLLLTGFGSVDTAWVVLEIGAVVALLLAIGTDGLFGSASSRKHLGWLALALAVGGLWWRLAGSKISDVEPYVLPLAGALLLIAFFVWRAARSTVDGTSAERSAAPLIALGGLLVAILPIALNAATGPVERAVIIGAVSATLLLGGSLLRTGGPTRVYLDIAAVAGALGVLTVMIGRAWFSSTRPGVPDVSLDAWLGAGLLVLLLGAVGQSLPRTLEVRRLRPRLAEGLLVAALTVAFLFELVALDASDAALPRAFGVVIAYAVLHVVAVAIARAPFTALVSWVALGFAAVSAGAGLITGALDEVEYASLPVALALLGGGAIHLSRQSEARSWPHLGPGMLVLMVPSLLATFEDRPLWRAIGLAVVGITIVVIGLLRRLQAPFVVAAVVTIVHTIATFSPQLRELYELNSWLVWIVVGTLGGTLLVVLAARFEKSLNTARTTLRRVSELR